MSDTDYEPVAPDLERDARHTAQFHWDRNLQYRASVAQLAAHHFARVWHNSDPAIEDRYLQVYREYMFTISNGQAFQGRFF